MAMSFYRQLRKRGVRIVRTVHNIHPHKFVLPPLVTQKLDVAEWKRADSLIVHSDRLKKQLQHTLGGVAQPLHVVPHGIWPVKSQVKRERGGKRKTVLFFGNVRANKGLHILLDALPLLSDYHLVIAGRISEEAYYTQEVEPRVNRLVSQGSSIECILKFIPDEEVGALFARADVLALPYTDFHAMSGILFDALAYRVPVVASESGGIADVMGAFDIGEMFDGTPEDLARSIGQVVSRPSGAYNVAFDRAHEQLSWGAVASKTQRVYEQLLST